MPLAKVILLSLYKFFFCSRQQKILRLRFVLPQEILRFVLIKFIGF